MSVKFSKWTPTQNLMQLRRFGKLLEELGELSAVVARCIIQGIDEVDPSSGRLNRHRLEDEMADVEVQINCTLEALGLDRVRMSHRRVLKTWQMLEWEAMFSEEGGEGK